MQKNILATLSLTASILALGSGPTLAMQPQLYEIQQDKTIHVPKLAINQAANEMKAIMGALVKIKDENLDPLSKFAESVLPGIKDINTARSALADYNARARAHNMMTSSSKHLGGLIGGGLGGHGKTGGNQGHSNIDAHSFELMIIMIEKHMKDCVENLKDLQEKIKQAESAGEGGGDPTLINELREEIKRLGGNTRAIEQASLPSLNSPFVHVTGAVAVINPLAAKARKIQESMVSLLEKLLNEIGTGVINFKNMIQKRKWLSKLEEFKEVLEKTAMDWEEFSILSVQIASQDNSAFAGGKIPEDDKDYKPLIVFIKELTDMRSELEASQDGEKFEAKQKQILAEDSLTGNLDTITDHFLTQVAPGLVRLIEKVEAKPDAILAGKLKEILRLIRTRKLNELQKYLNTTVKGIGIKTSDLIDRAIVFLQREKDWKEYLNTFAQYKSAVAALDAHNTKILVLLHMMRHGKYTFDHILNQIRIEANTNVAFHKEVEGILAIPNVFDLTGADRKKFMEEFNTLKLKYEKNYDKDPLAKLVMDLYFSYYEVFDAASSLFWDENPPPKANKKS